MNRLPPSAERALRPRLAPAPGAGNRGGVARAPLLLLLCLGCVRPGPGPDDKPTDTADTDAEAPLLLGVACVEDAARFARLESRLAEVPTVGIVFWETTAAAEGQVAFTFGEGNVLTPPRAAATEHEALMLGVPPNTTVTFRVVSTDAEGVWCSAEHELVTGLPPATLPELAASTPDPERASGAFVPVSLLAREERQVFTAILDGAGRYVWFRNQGEFHYRVMISADRQAILSNTQAASPDLPGAIYRTDFRGSIQEKVEVVGAHTDFAELPDGTLATLAWTVREFEDGTRHILGDRIVEVAPDGTQTEVWNIFDHIEPDLSVVYEPGWDEPDSGNEDWSHANGLSYDAAADAYLLTFFRFDAVARVSRTTGEVEWMLSPEPPPVGATFTSTSEPYPIANPHSVRALDADTLLVLNRGWFTPGECSEVVEVSVDTAAHTVTRDWTYATEDCVQNIALGDAHRMENGNTFVAWSFSGQLDEVTPEGDVVWQVNTDLGEAFGFSEPVMSLY